MIANCRRRQCLFSLVVAAVFWINCGGVVHAQSVADSAVPKLPGVRLAEGISQMTGVAISPLLGVSCVGAWTYWQTPAEQRVDLAWYCHPYAWGFGFSLLAMCFAKDLFGTVAPPLVKKPLDVAELFEDKISALIVSVGFVPLLASELLRAGGGSGLPASAPDAALSLPAEGMLAAVPLAGISGTSIMLVPVMVMLFLVVWLASHTINVLIVLSPFGMLDSVLKLIKVGLMAVVAASALLSPWIGLVVCIPIMIAAILIAPRAYRLSLFGSWFGFDLVRFMKLEKRQAESVESLRSFSSRGFAGRPARTCGRISRHADGTMVFRSRKMGLIPTPASPLPTDGLVLVRGLWCPLLLQESCDEAGRKKTVPLFMLSPRYRSREDEVAAAFGIVELRDGALAGGFKAVRQWLRETLITGCNNEVIV